MSSTLYLRNINPLGQADVPILGRQGEPYGEPGVGCLEPGEVVEVPAELAGRAPIGTPSYGEPENAGYIPASEDWDPGEGLLAQATNYELAAGPGSPFDAMTIPELREYAANHDPAIDLTGATKKSDIVALIEEGA